MHAADSPRNDAAAGSGMRQKYTAPNAKVATDMKPANCEFIGLVQKSANATQTRTNAEITMIASIEERVKENAPQSR